MKTITDTNDLQNFEFCKRYSTGNSYIKALENSTKVLFKDVESVFNFLKITFKGFREERKNLSFTRWQYLDTHFSDWFLREYLDIDNLSGFERLLNEGKEIQLYSRMSYDIKINKVKDDDYSVEITTFAHIKLLEGTIQWLDEEQAKIMIARKINAIHKK